jgi:hypothetical protein
MLYGPDDTQQCWLTTATPQHTQASTSSCPVGTIVGSNWHRQGSVQKAASAASAGTVMHHEQAGVPTLDVGCRL